MKKFLFVAASITFILSVQAQSPGRHVILITVDGMRPEFYQDPLWPAPNLHHLMQEGAYAKHVRSVFPTVTLPITPP